MKTKDGIVVTKHALERANKRANIGGKGVVRFARKALSIGLGFDNTQDRDLIEFIKSKYQCHYKGNNIRIYGHYVYVFKNNILITILDLPEVLWRCWDEYSRKLKTENKEMV